MNRFPSSGRRLLLAGLALVSVALVVLPHNRGPVRVQGQQCGGSDQTLIFGEVEEELWGVGHPDHANQTVTWEFTQSNSGIMGFSRSRSGPFTDSLSVPVTLDGNGNGETAIYIKGLVGGQTVKTACIVGLSPSPDCSWVENWTVKGCACPPIIPQP